MVIEARLDRRFRRRQQSRAGRGPRIQASRRTRSLLVTWRTLALVTGLAGFGAALIAATWVVYKAVGHPMSPLLLGFFIGAVGSTVLWIVWTYTTQLDGSMSWRIGESGEIWTASELRKLGSEWTTFHNVVIAGTRGGRDTEIDHIAIGPGGILVIDSKVRTYEVDLSQKTLPPEVMAHIRGIRWQGHELERLVPLKLRWIPMRRLLVYWGPRVISPPGSVRVDGDVTVVVGRDWSLSGSQLGEMLTPDQVEVLSTRLAAHVELIDARERRSTEAVARRDSAARLARRSALGSVALTSGLAFAITLGSVWDVAERVIGLAGGPFWGVLYLADLGLTLGSVGAGYVAGEPRRRRLLLPLLSFALFIGGTTVLLLLA